jgi:hypothetical protein
MRDYGNMRVLEWTDTTSARKAAAQITHQEPVILFMPEHFDCTTSDESQFAGKRNEESGIVYDCDTCSVLNYFAKNNDSPSLRPVVDACAESSSRVSIDAADRRIIVHD